MITLRYRFANVQAIEEKVKAFEMLYGNKPQVHLHGTWKESSLAGDLVFFDVMASSPVVGMKGQIVKVLIDGSIAWLKGGPNSEFSIVGEESPL